MRIFRFAFCLSLATIPFATSAEEESADLRYFRELVETRNYSLGQPVSPQITPSETVQHGLAEFVAQEEMDRAEGFWWSPDSQWLVYQETDNAGVESRFIADPLHPESPPAKNFYPRAGSNNAKVRLGIIARTGGATRWIEWDREKFPYLARAVWEEARAPLSILVQDRVQQDQRLLAVDSKTAGTRELLRETDSAWLNLDPRPMPVWFEFLPLLGTHM
jgi:dipeptidyl-peptidase-4